MEHDTIKAMKLKIVTPEKIVYENEVKQVTVPTTSGQITVMQNHIPLISVIQAGELIIQDNDNGQVMAIAGGFLEVKANNEMLILADNAERAEEINLERAEQARARAIEQMEKVQNEQDVDFAKLQAVIDREMNRLRVGKKYKNLPQAKS